MSHHYAKVPTSDHDQGTDHQQSRNLSRARSRSHSPVRLPSFSKDHSASNSVRTSPVAPVQADNNSDDNRINNDNHYEDDDDLDLQALSFGEDDEASQQQQQRQQLLDQELQEDPQRQYGDHSAPSIHVKYSDFRRALDPYLSFFSSTSSSLPSSSSGTSSGGPSSSATTARRLPFSSTADGVFANISAKPEVEGQKNQELQPPAYDSAIQDVTPPYFEMTVVTPRAFGDDVLVDGLPVGNFFQFLWNVAVAVSFQFLGALLTYLLHNSHASKASNGSMVGLGLTLVNFGIRMRGGFAFSSVDPQDAGSGVGEVTQVERPPSVDDTGYIGGGGMDQSPPTHGSEADSAQMDWLQTEAENQWASLLLMILGWMIIIKALAAYAIAKKTERIISAQPSEDREYPRASIDSVSSDHYV
ncbi:hypothetical protein BGZ75_007836 [Mortierella antarctica]|nr:hypothetical protein BGZ75_007836 [Mortierella antarctica]